MVAKSINIIIYEFMTDKWILKGFLYHLYSLFSSLPLIGLHT